MASRSATRACATGCVSRVRASGRSSTCSSMGSAPIWRRRRAAVLGGPCHPRGGRRLSDAHGVGLSSFVPDSDPRGRGHAAGSLPVMGCPPRRWIHAQPAVSRGQRGDQAGWTSGAAPPRSLIGKKHEPTSPGHHRPAVTARTRCPRTAFPVASEKPPEDRSSGEVCLRDRWRDIVAGQGHHGCKHRPTAQESGSLRLHPQARPVHQRRPRDHVALPARRGLRDR